MQNLNVNMSIIMTRNKKQKFRYWFYLIATTAIIAIAFLFQPINFQESIERKISSGENIPIQSPSYHAHADFKVFLDGEEFSFNKTQFDVANRYIHLHLKNPDGDKVIHVEGMENITLGIFFESLGIKFNASCFISDIGESYCNNFDKKVRIFVNGNENYQFDFYEPRNLDRILITYGNLPGGNIMKQMENVTDYACIYSNRCLERIAELPVLESELIF